MHAPECYCCVRDRCRSVRGCVAVSVGCPNCDVQERQDPLQAATGVVFVREKGSGRDRTRRSLGMDSPTLALSRRMEVEVGSGKRLTCARRCPAAGAKCTANALSSQRATVAQRSDGGSEQEAKVPWCSQISGEERKTGSGC